MHLWTSVLLTKNQGIFPMCCNQPAWKLEVDWIIFCPQNIQHANSFDNFQSKVIFAWRRWRESGNIHLAIKRRGRWVLDGKTATELCSVKVTRWPIDLQRMWAKSSRTQQVSRNKKCKHSQWSIPMFEHGQMVGTIHIEKHTVKVYRGHMGSCLNHAEIGRNLPVSSDLLSFPNSMVSKCFDTKKMPWIYTQWCWYIVVGFSSQKKKKEKLPAKPSTIHQKKTSPVQQIAIRQKSHPQFAISPATASGHDAGQVLPGFFQVVLAFPNLHPWVL